MACNRGCLPLTSCGAAACLPHPAKIEWPDAPIEPTPGPIPEPTYTPRQILTGIGPRAGGIMQLNLTSDGALISLQRNSVAYGKTVDGIYRAFSTNVPVFQGGRVILDTVYATDDQGIQYVNKPGLLIGPAVTNEWTRAREPDQWTGLSAGASFIYAEDGIDGGTVAAPTLEDASGTVTAYYHQDFAVVDGELVTVRVWSKKDATATVHPRMQIVFAGGTQHADFNIAWNVADGTHNAPSLASLTVADDGDWWIVTAAMTNDFTGNTTCSVRLCPSSHPGNFVNDVALTGSNTFDAPELYREIQPEMVKGLPPVLNTTDAPMVREQDVVTITGASATSGAIFSQCKTHETGTVYDAFAAYDSTIGPSGQASMNFDDGTTQFAADYAPELWINLGVVWDVTDALMGATVGQVATADYAFDGGIYTTLTLGSADSVVELRSLQVFDQTEDTTSTPVIIGA